MRSALAHSGRHGLSPLLWALRRRPEAAGRRAAARARLGTARCRRAWRTPMTWCRNGNSSGSRARHWAMAPARWSSGWSSPDRTAVGGCWLMSAAVPTTNPTTADTAWNCWRGVRSSRSTCSPSCSYRRKAFGWTPDELLEVFRDLAARKVDILTVGQYLRPSKDHLPMTRYYTPEEFAFLKTEGLKMGFRHVESGPLVRSSYHAHEQAESTGLISLGTSAAQ